MTGLRQASGWQQRHTLVLASFVALFIAYLDRVNIAVAGIAMQESLGWSETEKGFVLSSFFIGYMAAQIVGGVLADKYGGKKVLVASLVAWSLFTILTPLAGSASFAALILVRIGLGLGEAPLSPAVLSLFGKWIPETERSRSVAVYSSAAIAGTLVALVVTGLLVASYGWQIVFYAFGFAGLVYAVYLQRALYETPAEHPRASTEEKALFAEQVSAEGKADISGVNLEPGADLGATITFSVPVGALRLHVLMPSYFCPCTVLISAAWIYTMAPWAAMFVMMNVAG